MNRTALFLAVACAGMLFAAWRSADVPGGDQPSVTAAAAVAPVAETGCEREYGTSAHCVPQTYPPGVTDRCAWLLAHGYEPLQVIGPDRLGLDTNHNGIACDPGDH